MTTELIVVGAGGAGREAIDIVTALNKAHPSCFTVVGVVDDGPRAAHLERLERLGVPHLGALKVGLTSFPAARFVVGVADPAVRHRLYAQISAASRSFTTLIHPDAALGSDVTIGDGALIAAGVRISTGVRIDEQVHVAAGALIGHDTHLSGFTTVSPGAIVSGEVTVGPGAFVGAGAVVLQNLRVGMGSVVGAAACVVGDVAASTTVKGVPAR
ncbi:hypothetical protein AX769_02335 [Frondihabitans sp. PAMC 28766]|uniref:NeuD/PglB/VioB family sugar acetyltransferase n=1 Tax=Frondihabitans sp. PAMC 28766 TaxID=1795630 RepID=UPI00078C3D55|nr:NeuD/PglB/VioB family sugar acetyltransferase [Frondihabitans sp. PAMC 28766]AMM19180.1 hypothetical protein AX769_02335 [Frondihabitans sp. PAMC 28766]